MSEREARLRSEFEALTQRVYTRESSTLTIATFTTGSALVFVAIVANAIVAKQGLGDPRLLGFGVLFVIAGILYRELTVFSIDRQQLRMIRRIEHKLFPQWPKPNACLRFFRWLVFRMFMWSPAVLLLRLTALFDRLHILAFAFVMGVLIYPLPAAFAEYWFLDRDP